MGLFSSSQGSNLRATTKMVEAVISELGLSPEGNRLQTETGEPAWGLMRGSAEVFIFLHQGPSGDEGNHLRVVSPVLTLPADTAAQLRLLRRLLQLNATELSGVAFGLKGETVVLTADRTTVDLDPSEVKDIVLRIGYYADHYDDALVTEFGGQRHAG
ncbi:MAG: YbjN domain-containing protein [Deltaproteobacteria bacterium]|nr:YbjN domain-containing protein [Deltaproteobacteria bacterium]